MSLEPPFICTICGNGHGQPWVCQSCEDTLDDDFKLTVLAISLEPTINPNLIHLAVDKLRERICADRIPF